MVTLYHNERESLAAVGRRSCDDWWDRLRGSAPSTDVVHALMIQAPDRRQKIQGSPPRIPRGSPGGPPGGPPGGLPRGLPGDPPGDTHRTPQGTTRGEIHTWCRERMNNKNDNGRRCAHDNNDGGRCAIPRRKQ